MNLLLGSPLRIGIHSKKCMPKMHWNHFIKIEMERGGSRESIWFIYLHTFISQFCSVCAIFFPVIIVQSSGLGRFYSICTDDVCNRHGCYAGGKQCWRLCKCMVGCWTWQPFDYIQVIQLNFNFHQTFASKLVVFDWCFFQPRSEPICTNILLDNVFGFERFMDISHELRPIECTTVPGAAGLESRSKVI